MTLAETLDEQFLRLLNEDKYAEAEPLALQALESGSDRTCETKTDAVVHVRRVAVALASQGPQIRGIVDPNASAKSTIRHLRIGCAIQIVPLPDVAALIKRAVETPAATKRAYVSTVADARVIL